MQVVIAGCGRVGSLLAQTLASEGHDVVVVDRDPDSFDRLGAAFNGLTLRGLEFDQEVLERAGIATADVFVAATNSDSANAMAALMARDMYGVKRVVCRIYEPMHEYAFQRLGLVTVAASGLAAAKIHNEILPLGRWTDLLLADGQVVVERFRPTCAVAGRSVAELEVPGSFRVAALVRGAAGMDVVIPSPETLVEREDLIVGVIRTSALSELRERFGF